jgi:alpha-amylase
LSLAFHVHQPYRLARCSSLEPLRPRSYLDTAANEAIVRRIAARCYVPATRALAETLRRCAGSARVAFSITGTALEQLTRTAPEGLAAFQDIARTGCVDFLGETYYHSLASLYDDAEFSFQVEHHAQALTALVGVRPTVFRNTELVYDDRTAALVAACGFKGIIAEGVDAVLADRSVHAEYLSPAGLPLLLRDYRSSDDIAFRFTANNGAGAPLDAGVFLARLSEYVPPEGVVLLYVDYETFGEHHSETSGIIEFLATLPERALESGEWRCVSPVDALTTPRERGVISFPQPTSWADTRRDISAWRGNKMQQSALDRTFDLGPALRHRGDAAALEMWRRLLSSDHFYYMATPHSPADKSVHAGFSPYESPYEAFINYMNVLRHFRAVHLEGAPLTGAWE